MGAIVSQITSLTIVYSTVYSDVDQRKHQSAASLAFVRGIHRGPVNSPHKWPVTRKMFPFDDVIMLWNDIITTTNHSTTRPTAYFNGAYSSYIYHHSYVLCKCCLATNCLYLFLDSVKHAGCQSPVLCQPWLPLTAGSPGLANYGFMGQHIQITVYYARWSDKRILKSHCTKQFVVCVHLHNCARILIDNYEIVFAEG